MNDIFLDAREQGRRDSRDAYAFDALMALARRMESATDGGDGHERDKVILRVDARALDRGRVEPGEVCEIAGHGPVPVAEAWKSIDGGALVAALLTDGTDILRVVHLGRKPTVLQRTVLEWETAGTCAVEGCTNTARIEIDHVDDWAHTRVTHIGELAAICTRCHDLKTHRGYTLGPRLPNGKRRLIPPGDGTGDPRGQPTGVDGGPPRTGGARSPERPEPASEQPGLFDTG